MTQLHPTLPTTPFPLLPLRNGVLFPGTVITVPVGRARSIALIEALEPGKILGVAVQRDGARTLRAERRARAFGRIASPSGDVDVHVARGEQSDETGAERAVAAEHEDGRGCHGGRIAMRGRASSAPV